MNLPKLTICLTLIFIPVIHAFEILNCDQGFTPLMGLENTLFLGEKMISNTYSDPPKELVEMGKRLKNTNDCSEKIWPDFKLPQTPIRIIEPSRSSTYKYNPLTGQFEWERMTSERDKEVRGFEPNTDNDGGMTVNGSKYIEPLEKPEYPVRTPPPSICQDEKKALQNHTMKNKTPSKLSRVDDMLVLTAHESFHSVDQRPDNVIHNDSSPCKWHKEDIMRTLPGDISDLKMARQHLITNLLKAYKAPKESPQRAEALSQIKFWGQYIEEKYPNESQILQSVDRAEGTAEYVGMMSNVYGSLGCSPSHQDKRNLIISHLENRYFPEIQATDQQAYLIGAISGLLLDEESTPNWKDEVTRKKISPFEHLKSKSFYKNISAGPVQRNNVLVESAKLENKVNNCISNEIKKVMDPLFSGDEEFVLVQLDPVSFSTSGFHNYTTPNNQEVSLSLGSSSSGDTVKVENQTLLRLDGLCPNGGSSNFVAVPKRLISNQGKVIPDEEYKITTVVDLQDQTVTWNSHLVDCR